MAEDRIQEAVDRFVTELRGLLVEEAREALLTALSGQGLSSPSDVVPSGVRRGRERPPAAPKRAKGGKRVRRTAADLEAIQEKIIAALKNQPGATSEQIQEALGMTKQDVQRPLTLLREENRVKTEGQKRGTRYYAKGRS